MARLFRRPILGLTLLAAAVAGGAWWYTAPPGEAPPAAAANPHAEPDLTLPEADKKYLWEIEHHGNLLSRAGFPALADALRRDDPLALRKLLAADFRGELLDRPREVRLRTGALDVVRRESGAGPPRAADRGQFVEHLLGYRRHFHKPPRVKLALMRLAPVERGRLDGPWQGTWQLRLWGEHAPGQPGEVIVYCRYRVRRPTRQALARGGWLTACAVTQEQVGSASHFLMREATAGRGIDPRLFHDNWRKGSKTIPQTGGVYVCDFNRDGRLDVLIMDLGRCHLYQGLPGGRFRDVTHSVGLPAVLPQEETTYAAAFVDLDGDGWEDLLLGDSLYRNAEGRFVNVTARSNLRLNRVTGIAVADFDRDGRMDLYVTRIGYASGSSWLSGKTGLPYGNQLWRNKGGWQFEDVTAASGTDGGNRSTFTAAWLDADGDGWPDLYVPNEFGDGVLYVNRHDGTFAARALTDHPSDFGTMGVAAGDLDGDGRIDLYAANMYSKAGDRVIANLRPGTYPDSVMAKVRTFVTGSQLHLNRGGTFEPVGRSWQVADAGWAYGPVLADLDNDGWLDVHALAGFVSQSRSEPDG